ncbi:antitoxin [Candidatus Phycosocius spiralis]|uniref:MazE family transcriptional regulator n=1 Tax=Candidatus Phycosocius spiralis TaxID=2815099 RepID=A0ABQ4PY33_9PROT|nr:antitoxin [Candidatus Phycosocius spiralis]GIU67933.1 MazE family transcriptional regulator [Candidatus Phycosocius spiralis]
MHTTKLRKVGGSVMLAVPPAILDVLQLQAGSSVGVSLDGAKLVVEATAPLRYNLDDLLAQSDYDYDSDMQDRDWLDAPAIGGELL